jgi:hypothetical protein
MQGSRAAQMRVVVGVAVAMGILLAAGSFLGVPMWLLLAAVAFSLVSVGTVVLAQRPGRAKVVVDLRRLIGLFVIVPLLVGLSGFVSVILGSPPTLIYLVVGVTFLGGNYIFLRYFDHPRGQKCQ